MTVAPKAHALHDPVHPLEAVNNSFTREGQMSKLTLCFSSGSPPGSVCNCGCLPKISLRYSSEEAEGKYRTGEGNKLGCLQFCLEQEDNIK